jgi:hypothetical protein
MATEWRCDFNTHAAPILTNDTETEFVLSVHTMLWMVEVCRNISRY